MSEKLAIFGGSKTINYEFAKYNSIGSEELDAASAVIKTGVLSQFLGSHSEDFYGGPKVKEFELNSCDMQKVSIAAGGDVKEKSIICSFGEFKVDRFAQIHPK